MGMFVVAPATSFQHDSSFMVDAHHHHHHHHGGGGMNNAATALGVGVGVGVIPLFNTGPSEMDGHDSLFMGRNRTGAIQLWQAQQQQTGSTGTGTGTGSPNYPKKTLNFDPTAPNLLPMGCGGGAGALTCQDCGNQAKKDCSHRRCRTCCRSRGFDCSTHVKSTWVPAARRRERQMMGTDVAGAASVGPGGGGGASSGSTSGGAKKPRLISSQNTATTSHTSTSNTPPRSFDISSSHQDASFKESLPGQVRAAAVFKCVRVTAVDDGDDEFAYQAVVNIGGHVFKGFLYDQGAEPRDAFPNLSELNLGGGGSGGGGGRNAGIGASSSSPLLHPSDSVYGPSATGGLLAGSTYVHH